MMFDNRIGKCASRVL